MSANVTMLRPPSPEERSLHERGFVYGELLRSLGSVEDAERIPWLIKEAFRVEAWKDRPTPLGKILPPSDLYHFIHDKPPDGLGTTYDVVEKLIRDDPEALSLWTEATRKAPHRPPSTGSVDNINASVRPTGTSREQAIRRLNKAAEEDEKAADLKAAVLGGEMSAHAAAVQMGWRKKRTAYQDMVTGWRRATDEERNAFEDYIGEWRRRDV